MTIGAAAKKPPGFSQCEVFPIIASTIDRLSSPSREFVNHELIVEALSSDPYLRPLIERIVARDSLNRTSGWWASNMLQFFSKAFTEGRLPDERRFERRKIKRDWAYKTVVEGGQLGERISNQGSERGSAAITKAERMDDWTRESESGFPNNLSSPIENGSCKPRTPWAWAKRNVDPRGEYFELRYGSAQDPDWNVWVPVARVGAPMAQVLGVQFLVERTGPTITAMIDAVIDELDFYLVKKGERNPWEYAKYHCGTASNIYSSVHWSFHPAQGASPSVAA